MLRTLRLGCFTRPGPGKRAVTSCVTLAKVFSSVIALAARGGKSSSLLRWLTEGQAIPAYPGWSRVVACADRQSRQQFATMAAAAGELSSTTLTFCVVEVAELPAVLAEARGAVQYAIDDVERAIQTALGVGQSPAVVSITLPDELAAELADEPSVVCRHCLSDTRRTPPATDGSRCPRCRAAYTGPARKAEFAVLRDAGLITPPLPRKERT